LLGLQVSRRATAALERKNVMLRNFGISLLLFGLLLAGIDGFADRESTLAPSNGITNEEGGVHTAEFIGPQPPR
jgi:hypothetical protein